MGEEGRFSHARFAEQGDVPATIVGEDAKCPGTATEHRPAEDGNVGVSFARRQVGRLLVLAALHDGQSRGAHGVGRRVPESRDFLGREQE